jgi:hypothetical protein
MSEQTRAVLEDNDDGALRPLNCFIIEVSLKHEDMKTQLNSTNLYYPKRTELLQLV